jgi:hypothetical protein
MDTVEALTAANESTLNIITAVQDQIIDTYKELAPAVQSALQPPTLPSWLPVPGPEDARDVVAKAFEFQTQLLEADKAFALNLLEVWAPKPARASKAK